MRWRKGRRSHNIEDRRGMSRQGGISDLFPRGMRRGVGRRGGRGSILTILVVLAVMYFLGIDPRLLLQSGAIPGGSGSGSSHIGPQGGSGFQSSKNDELADFVSVVLADTEDTWKQLFGQMDRSYREPKLVLFSGFVRSACGMAQAAMGPFYCPADQKVYIDLSFYEDLKVRHGAPGDFAQAYVIAHEIGHHVQNLLGISDKVQSARRRVGEAEGNQLSVRLELQADCFAGVWGHHADRTRQILEEGDIEEALNAASSIGDDRLQRQSRGYVTPESFTHGSSRQRVHWFKRGIQNGDPQMCNTFDLAQLSP